MDLDQILSGLKTRWLGKDLRLYTRVGSTNDIARSLAQRGVRNAVILAETQSEGRGRLSRSWESPRGGIWMSLILQPDIPPAHACWINMAVCVAACRAISSLLDMDAKIKWPNDLLINERKVGGILIEISSDGPHLEYAIVGLGINANIDPSAFPPEWMASSLSYELGHEVPLLILIQGLLLELEEAYERIGGDEIYQEWRQRSVTLGRMVRIASNSGELVGEVEDLADDGAILLRTGGRVVRVLAGDCIHLRGVEGT
ncbi:MAG: biotin--[acetyl-CoA-carboxylase] ligase [Candidatus Methanosuratus sp.]|nr:biotin--[acetyl-CoA-carboxylase] ligase [Candidatus Methanosuratincola sp.]